MNNLFPFFVPRYLVAKLEFWYIEIGLLKTTLYESDSDYSYNKCKTEGWDKRNINLRNKLSKAI